MSTIVRVAHGRDPYVVIDRRPLEDERLGWAPRGLLAYLLAKPDDWDLRIEDLKRRGDLGRDGLYRILKELEHYGYLEREIQRNARGRVTKVVYTVFEVPDLIHHFLIYRIRLSRVRRDPIRLHRFRLRRQYQVISTPKNQSTK